MKEAPEEIVEAPHEEDAHEEATESFEDIINEALGGEVEEEETEVEGGETSVVEPQEHVGTAQKPATAHKYVCPICGREFDNQRAYAAHMRWHKYREKKEAEKAAVEAEPESEEVGGEGGLPLDVPSEPLIRSPKEELEHWFISQLANRLPMAVGKKRAEIIVDTLKEDPDIIWDPHLLKMHIMQLAPVNTNKYLLDWILRVLYKQLEDKKRNLEESYGFMLESVSPPEDRGYLMSSIHRPRDKFDFNDFETHRRITPPRNGFDRDAFEFEDYEYEGRRRRPRRRFYEDDDFDFVATRSDNDTRLLYDLVTRLIDEIRELKEARQAEPLVEIPAPDGSGTIRAPPSMVPLILQMYKKKEREEPYVEIPNPYGEGIIRVPESLAPKYIEMLRKEERPKEPMVDVPNPFGEGVIQVPASLAPLYIEIKKLQEERKKGEEEAMVEIPNPTGEGTLKVPASLAPLYMSLLRLTEAVKEARKPEERKIKIFSEEKGEFIEMTPEEAVHYLQLRAERERQKQLEATIESLKEQINRMYATFHPENVSKLLSELGYAQQGSPTLALLQGFRKDINEGIQRILDLAEQQMKNQMALLGQPAPNVGVPQGAPAAAPQGAQTSGAVPPAPSPSQKSSKERQKKIQKIKEAIKRAEEAAKIEKEIAGVSTGVQNIEIIEAGGPEEVPPKEEEGEEES